MDIQFHGANCITFSASGVRVVVDDNLAELGAKSVLKAGDIALFTGPHANVKVDAKLTIDGPGEFEVADVSIQGIPVRAHIDEEGQRTATMYKVSSKDINVLVLGHIYPELSDDDLERIGIVDVLITPVGGNGYTLDPVGALSVIKKIEPKLVIPTHYADKALQYPVPQQSLEDALKGLAMESQQTTAKLRLKPADLSDGMKLTILEKA
jgi:L-ascorbate metabolism protein UlaG (beta-lactamase superfamily)